MICGLYVFNIDVPASMRLICHRSIFEFMHNHTCFLNELYLYSLQAAQDTSVS
jgi:hypothetical protein